MMNTSAWSGCLGLPLVTLVAGQVVADDSKAQAVAKEIREEATRTNSDSAGHPLPLACSWCCGHFPSDLSAVWRPENQLQLIAQGHHLLPWFAHPLGDVPADPEAFGVKYYKAAIERARDLKLPLTFVASQWESFLSGKPYVDLPAAQNPNVVTAEGKIQPRVSPFGPVAPWREVGRTHTDNPWMKQIQQWYPDPPLIIFLSNNEHGKLHWTEVETEPRYIEKFGKGRDNNFKRQVVVDGWIERYRALQGGLRDGLANETWKKNSIYIGYDAFGPPHIGRWGGKDPADGTTPGGWLHYSLYTAGRIDPSPLMWDGGSPSYYTDDWNQRTDHTMWSPQEEYRQEDRWFLLDTTLDPARPWNLGTALPVFGLALTRGQAPHREWLVYAHAPLREKKAVGVAIPGYKAVTVDVPVAGAFYQASEATGGVEAIR
jgi:hypothetical protein